MPGGPNAVTLEIDRNTNPIVVRERGNSESIIYPHL